MRKVFSLLLLMMGLHVSMLAQSQQGGTTSRSTTAVNSQKLEYVKDCPALKKQLTDLFGENYSLEQSNVVTQLQRNIADTKADRCIRKASLKVIYGNDYVNKLHLIDNSK